MLRALRANGATPIPELEQELLWVAQASPRGLRVHSALALYYTLLGPVGRQKRERAIAKERFAL